jgi:hypothetical protein
MKGHQHEASAEPDAINWDHASILIKALEEMAVANPHATLKSDGTLYVCAKHMKQAADLIRRLAPPDAIIDDIIPF